MADFTRAAPHLFITQPALPRRIWRLERQYMLMFASDYPFLPLERALSASRQLSPPAEALDDFLGNAAAPTLKLVG